MTNVLVWGKPKKKLTPDQWKDAYGFDGGPTGGYQPNMSDGDAKAWKAKLVGHTKGVPQVEIRRQCGDALLLVIVNLGSGYNYKHYTSSSKYDQYLDAASYDAAQLAAAEEEARKTGRDYMVSYYRNARTSEADLEEMKARASTRGINVHMSMNGPGQLTFEEWGQLNQAVEEAKAFLEAREAQ